MSPASARLGMHRCEDLQKQVSRPRQQRPFTRSNLQEVVSHTTGVCMLSIGSLFRQDRSKLAVVDTSSANICLKRFASAVSHTCASGVHVHSQEESVTPLPCSFALTAAYPFAGPRHSGHSAMGDSTLVTLFGRVLHSVWVNYGPH